MLKEAIADIVLGMIEDDERAEDLGELGLKKLADDIAEEIVNSKSFNAELNASILEGIDSQLN